MDNFTNLYVYYLAYVLWGLYVVPCTKLSLWVCLCPFREPTVCTVCAWLRCWWTTTAAWCQGQCPPCRTSTAPAHVSVASSSLPSPPCMTSAQVCSKASPMSHLSVKNTTSNDLKFVSFRGTDSSIRAAPDHRVMDPRWPPPRPHHLLEHAPLRQPTNQLPWCHTTRWFGALVCKSTAGLQGRQKVGFDQRHHWERVGRGDSFLDTPPQCTSGTSASFRNVCVSCQHARERYHWRCSFPATSRSSCCCPPFWMRRGCLVACHSSRWTLWPLWHPNFPDY